MAFIWTATVLLIAGVSVWASLRPSVRGKQTMLPSGVILWSVALVLQSPGAYEAIDGALGGQNLTNLIYRTTCLLALWCLDVMVLRARSESKRETETEIALALIFASAGLLQLALFMALPMLPSDTYLAAGYGQITREIYWNILPVAVAGFAVHALVSIVQDWDATAVRSTRWGLSLIACASVMELMWTAESLATSAIRVLSGTAWPGERADPIAMSLLIAMILFTAAGVLVAPSERFVDTTYFRFLAIRLTPIWWQGVKHAPTSAIEPDLFVPFRLSVQAELVLLRRLNEIRDTRRTGAPPLTPREARLVEHAATALWGTDAAASTGIGALLRFGGS